VWAWTREGALFELPGELPGALPGELPGEPEPIT